jgi:hypothetical protein
MAHIDWLSVYNYFISSDTITLADCANKFGVHVDYVRQVAAKQNWTTKKLQVRQTAIALMEQKTANEIAKRNEEHAKIGRAIQGVSLEALASGNFKPKSFEEIRKGLETGVKLERQALNLDKQPSVAIQQNNFNNTNFHTVKPKNIPFEIQWGNGDPVGTFIYSDAGIERVKTSDAF